MKCFTRLCLCAVAAIEHAIIPLASAAEINAEMQKQLLVKAAEWGVPQPKPTAKLLKVWVYKSGDEDFFALGFHEEGADEKALVGFDEWNLKNRHDTQKIADPDKISLDDISATSPFSEPHGVNFGLVTGIQLIRHGNPKLGLQLMEKSLSEDAGHHRSAFHSPAGESPMLMLARSCIADALNQITSAQPDFPKIKQRIETILLDQPTLKSKATEWALKGLDASVKYQPHAPGSLARLVDDYVMSGKTSGALIMHDGEFSPSKRALILKGFEAIPALLEQRHSERFSNHLMEGFNNFSSYPMSASQVINEYLQSLANDDLGSNWLDRQKGYTAEDDAVLAWWKTASALGEKAYVAKHTIVLDKKKEAKISQELLLIAQERYPDLLPGFYQSLLKTSQQSWPVAEALMATTKIPVEQKVTLFQAGIATKRDAHRNNALTHLQKLNVSLAEEHIIRLLKNAPRTTKDEYWTDKDAQLTVMVSRSINPQVWSEARRYIARADLGMRMELIDNLKPPREAPAEILSQFYAIYDTYSKDPTLRDELSSKKFSGPCAGFPHVKIEVRDFIARHWARWLKLEQDSPKKDATKKEWETYRREVEQAFLKHRSK